MKVGRLASRFFLLLNLFVAVGMVACALSVRISPADMRCVAVVAYGFPVLLLVNIVFVPFWLVFKRKYMLLPLISMLLCINSIRTFFPVNIARQQPEEGALKVMSYNTHNFGGIYNQWEENDVYRYIINQDADVVCLQESNVLAFPNVQERFKEVYPYIDFYVNHSAPLVLLSKMPIINREGLELDTRSNAAVAYRLLSDNDTLLVLNCHLESYKLNNEEADNYTEIVKGDKKRYKDILKNRGEVRHSYKTLLKKIARADSLRALQAEVVADYIRKAEADRVIVCGDFNSQPLSYVHRTICANLDDAYVESGNGMGASYNLHGMDFRIDNILISKNMSSSAALVDDGIASSDHYPIICWVKK